MVKGRKLPRKGVTHILYCRKSGTWIFDVDTDTFRPLTLQTGGVNFKQGKGRNSLST